MLVMKFGGTSVGTAGSIKQAVEIVRKNSASKPIVVVSAFSKVTDMLIDAGNKAAKGDVSIEAVNERCRGIMSGLGVDSSVVQPELDELKRVLDSVATIRQLLPELYALVVSFGERISSKVVASYACSAGLNAAAHNAYELGLVTDSSFYAADVLPESYEQIRKRISSIKDGSIPIVTGFIAKDSKGAITTLGRGGSDYTASIFGAAVGASEVQIWTDVDGIMTADPNVVPHAKTIGRLSYDEAAQLAHFGARVLHPKTIAPAIKMSIPVKILNTHNASSQGTAIVRDAQNNRSVTAITYKRGIATVNISSPEMLDATGYVAKLFAEFGKHRVPVDMIATSDISVSVTVDGSQDISPVVHSISAYAQVKVARDKASVSLVGPGIQSMPGIAAAAFECIGAQGINVEMISQGWSEKNLSFVVEDRHAVPAVQLLHRTFFENEKNIKKEAFSGTKTRGVV